MRLDIFKDCMKLILLIFEYLFKPNLYSPVSMEASIFSLLLDGSRKVMALASQQLGS